MPVGIKVQAGAEVRVGDVALVHDSASRDQTNIARVDGKRATYLAVLKKANASTLAPWSTPPATRSRPSSAAAPDGMELKIDFDQSVFVSGWPCPGSAAPRGGRVVAARLAHDPRLPGQLAQRRRRVDLDPPVDLRGAGRALRDGSVAQHHDPGRDGARHRNAGRRRDRRDREHRPQPRARQAADRRDPRRRRADRRPCPRGDAYHLHRLLPGRAADGAREVPLHAAGPQRRASRCWRRTCSRERSCSTLARMLMENEHHGPPGGLGRLRVGAFDAAPARLRRRPRDRPRAPGLRGGLLPGDRGRGWLAGDGGRHRFLPRGRRGPHAPSRPRAVRDARRGDRARDRGGGRGPHPRDGASRRGSRRSTTTSASPSPTTWPSCRRTTSADKTPTSSSPWPRSTRPRRSTGGGCAPSFRARSPTSSSTSRPPTSSARCSTSACRRRSTWRSKGLTWSARPRSRATFATGCGRSRARRTFASPRCWTGPPCGSTWTATGRLRWA